MGRFWSPDPGGVKTARPDNPGTWNRYQYVAGDPVNFLDPQGSDLLYADCGAWDGYGFTGEVWVPVLVGYCRMLKFWDPFGPDTGLRVDTGGGGGAIPAQIRSVNQARDLLIQAIHSLDPHCQDLLPSQDILLGQAGMLNFLDASPTSATGQQTVAQVVPWAAPYNANGTLGQVVGSNNALILAGPNDTITNYVLLSQTFFSDPATGNDFTFGQGTVLVHELLHYVTGKDDDDFVDAYHIVVHTETLESPSSAISRWLQHGCKN